MNLSQNVDLEFGPFPSDFYRLLPSSCASMHAKIERIKTAVFLMFLGIQRFEVLPI